MPPYVLRAIATNGDEEDRARALIALQLSSAPRRERQALTQLAGMLLLPERRKRRTVYDAHEGRELPGRIARAEGERRTRDARVNEAYENTGRTYDFFRRVYGRRSVDDQGLGIRSSVHFAKHFNNAHWDGRQMIYGDGDGKYFRSFTTPLDIVAHELTHGVTQYTAVLGASGQCGALAEHFSDVFGILAKQYWLKQSARQSDWLIGAELFTERVHGAAIRSMKAPGTAYDDRILGRDPQPAHMRDFVKAEGDDRGVHANCGIPNHAFYRAAIAIGGNAWEIAGRIWYHALTRSLGPRARFQHCADATSRAAADLFGENSTPHDAVVQAWGDVGIPVRDVAIDLPVAAAELPVLV